jgi:hypothetical protein
MKRPAFQFYPSDWRTDASLQFCSLSARGLWVEMMCIAHECEPYGHLTINSKPMTAAQIGRLVGISERECTKLLGELFEAGVPSRTSDGTIYSRRMVRDEEVRERRAAGGKSGAEHGAKGGSHGIKGGRPTKQKTPQEPPLVEDGRGVSEPPLKPPPSSSSSSSSSVNLSEANASGGEPPAIESAPTPLSPDEIIFGYGLPMLTSAGVVEKQARSFLGGLRKAHGDTALIDKLRECLKAKPLQPLEWLAAALPPGGGKASRHSGFDKIDYRAGVSADGRF